MGIARRMIRANEMWRRLFIEDGACFFLWLRDWDRLFFRGALGRGGQELEGFFARGFGGFEFGGDGRIRRWDEQESIVFADSFAQLADFDQHFGLGFENQETGERFLVGVVALGGLRL